MQTISRSVSTCLISMVTLWLLLTASLPLFAADAEFEYVSTEMLKNMLDQEKVFVLIDTRTKEEYQEAHIGRAIHIAEKDFEKLAGTLPADKGTLLVLYCNGVKCGKSKKVAGKAKAVGYANILVYNEGFPVWEEKEMPIVAEADYVSKNLTNKISPAELEMLLRQKKEAYVLLDVREEFEFAAGHIPGAINIPAGSLAARSSALPKDKGIIVYCNSSGGSQMAYRKLKKLGLPSITQAVFSEWRDAGLPVAKSQL